ADQRDELLIEDDEFLYIQLLTAEEAGRGSGASRLDRVDQESLVDVALAQFLFAGGGSDLLVNLSPPIGVFENEVGHGYCVASTTLAPLGTWNLNNLSSSGGSTFSWSNWNSITDRSNPMTFTILMWESGATRNSTLEYGRLSVLGSAVMRWSGPSALACTLLNSFSKFNLPSRKASGARMSSLSCIFIRSALFSSGVYSQRYLPSPTNSLPLGWSYSHRMRPGLRRRSLPLSARRGRPGGVYPS